MKSSKQQPSFNLKRICALCIVVYVALVILLYFLMGHQLHFRESRGDIALPVAEAGTVELAQGAVLEQTFSMEVQRLQEISVQWGPITVPTAARPPWSCTTRMTAPWCCPKPLIFLKFKRAA